MLRSKKAGVKILGQVAMLVELGDLDLGIGIVARS